MHIPIFLLTILTTMPITSTAQGVNAGYDVQKVKSQMLRLATHSWEYGTAAQALLELDNPELSIFGASPFPIPGNPSGSALEYAKQHITLTGDTLINGDGALGDPASLGIPALLLGKTDQRYRDAAERQTLHIFQAPKWPNGAISHRESVAELWADFIYMVPPYLAYHGAYKSDEWLLRQAISQCALYRDVLKSPSGLWTHIEGPQSADRGRWSTGNAWAAAGILRVLATITKAPQSRGWRAEQDLLKSYLKEILDGAMSAQKDGGLLRNYLDDGSWFGEVSGTTLLVAVAYRAHTMHPDTFGRAYLDWAEEGRGEIARRVDGNGILAPAVNPLSWGDRNPVSTGSPEANAFGVLLYTAYRDYVNNSGK
ncbi:unnamed protein product [Tuber aestivum]|uniref:Glycosyl hydrolase family 88 n=1 Tax=Tuber aestivum TaxID=59557 RepID=A0A292PM01_9PEZI|nr:unnamed protein product [Tuber aestivum]